MTEFESIDFLAKWPLIDLPFEPTLRNKAELFMMLDKSIQAEGLVNGPNDTVFRDRAFEDICRKVLHLEPEEYYSSCTYMDFKATGHYISIR